MISQALTSQQAAPPSQQLSHASKYLAQHGNSGSSQVYSQGLAQAAQQLQGQPAVTPDNAMLLMQPLPGGGQQSSPPPGADLLGTLLGGLQSAQTGGNSQGDAGLEMGDLLNAGMTFMSARQQAAGNLQAALSALMAAGPLGQKQHRQQSGQVGAKALLQAIAGMSGQR